MVKTEKGTVWMDLTMKATASEVKGNDVTRDGVASHSNPRAAISAIFPGCGLIININMITIRIRIRIRSINSEGGLELKQGKSIMGMT